MASGTVGFGAMNYGTAFVAELESPRSRDGMADDHLHGPGRRGASEDVVGPTNEYYNPYVLKWLRDSEAAQREEDNSSGALSNGTGWERRREDWKDDELQPSQDQEDSIPTSEPTASSPASTDMKNEMDVDVLKHKIYDMGIEIWHMKSDHEQEKKKLKHEHDSKINKLRSEYDAKVEEMSKELRVKEIRLAENRQRTVQLEVQVEELQLKLHDLVIKQYQNGDSGKGRMMHWRASVEEGEMSDSSRSGSRGYQELTSRSNSFRHTGHPSINYSQEKPGQTCTSDVTYVPPKHLQRFSPLTMSRRGWTSRRLR